MRVRSILRFLFFVPPIMLFSAFLFSGVAWYFVLLRIITTVFAIYYAKFVYTLRRIDACEFERNHGTKLFIAFIAITVVFNPIIPIYMPRFSWFLIDFVAGFIMLLNGYIHFRRTW